MKASRDHAPNISAATLKCAPHQVECDLCGGVMSVPTVCIEAGIIRGLLVCSQCVEDEAEARIFQ